MLKQKSEQVAQNISRKDIIEGLLQKWILNELYLQQVRHLIAKIIYPRRSTGHDHLVALWKRGSEELPIVTLDPASIDTLCFSGDRSAAKVLVKNRLATISLLATEDELAFELLWRLSHVKNIGFWWAKFASFAFSDLRALNPELATRISSRLKEKWIIHADTK